MSTFERDDHKSLKSFWLELLQYIYLDRYIKGLVSVIHDVIIAVVTSQYAKNINQYKY